MNFPATFAAASVVIRDQLSDPDCTLVRKAGGAVIGMRGSFENDFVVQMVDANGDGLEARRPVFEYVTLDYPEVVAGDQLNAPNGLQYKVVGIQPNKNFTLLILELK